MSTTIPEKVPKAVEAARNLCQEARVVLTSLRGGPPNVGRGDLANDLMDLRLIVKAALADNIPLAALPPDDEKLFFAHHAAEQQGSTAEHSSGTESEAYHLVDESLEGTVFVQAQPPPPIPPPESPIAAASWSEQVGPCARPFLAVVMDPRAAGPHTLVALRALYRLLERGSLLRPSTSTNQHPFTVSFEPLAKGVLSCKFEQTDAGADEAVEMAIADLLALLVRIDQRSIRSETLMEAFNTVFITRNTFVHSPALCYHFEDVLSSMIISIFSDINESAHLILEFMVNQLLHTPLGATNSLEESMREAQVAHSATRLLCLRLVNCALRIGWANDDPANEDNNRPELMKIIQDDLCLSLLMTGQAIWAYADPNSHAPPGLVSLDILSEICNTLATLWHTISLRTHLVPQFETIFTGFYQRALVLLRKRPLPLDSISFNHDLIFDAEAEVILESLVDLLCLHDFEHSVADGNGGSLETLFSTYDCHMSRSDVAAGIMMELCRCCGSSVNEEGEPLLTPSSSFVGIESATDGTAATSANDVLPESPSVSRPIPPHLKELCVHALMGSMKCLFRDDKASSETLLRRSQPQLPLSKQEQSATHVLRNIKSKKRLMRKGAHLFNQKASKGIAFLADSGLVSNPATPIEIASFLRNAIVVGLDKHAVGAYLGEAGKVAVAGKSPPVWERDWFHKEVLTSYCNLFRFERQSLLDGLRMFLASFRLPGEAQQIDRILQAFADSCSKCCEEAKSDGLNLFSEDPKKASDAAYLLSFSIIMLNTDQHNANIREDRKMTVDDFVRNNTDYGRDITEKGKEFPRDFLVGIYESIKEEEIRTEGEGADGCMTLERWKDVLRGSTEEDVHDHTLPSALDAEDLSELVLEHLWMPIMSAIGALWGVNSSENKQRNDSSHTGMLGVQGARLGMDMAMEMLDGVRMLRRVDIFHNLFAYVCHYTGLLSHFDVDAVTKTTYFAESLEAQSGVIVAFLIARAASDDLDLAGWKLIWLMIFKLRDMKMLGGRVTGTTTKSILTESDPDLLLKGSRKVMNTWLKKGDVSLRMKRSASSTSYLGAIGRFVFGADVDAFDTDAQQEPSRSSGVKQELVLWDELAGSDDEAEPSSTLNGSELFAPVHVKGHLGSVGAQFEYNLIRENILMTQHRNMPVTGLETVDETRNKYISPRARVRTRLAHACEFHELVEESRFMAFETVQNMLQALLDIIAVKSSSQTDPVELRQDDAVGDGQLPNLGLLKLNDHTPLSAGSEAFAEVLVCEIVLRNKDRLAGLWRAMLRSHYHGRLTGLCRAMESREDVRIALIEAGLEKCVTGLLRISACSATKENFASEILTSWKELAKSEVPQYSLLGSLDKHVGEGLWRIANNLGPLSVDGWEGLLALINWCAARGGQLPPIKGESLHINPTLDQDDPALQSYRSISLILNNEDLQCDVPNSIVGSMRAVIAAGELRNCTQLSIATLDLLKGFVEQRANLRTESGGYQDFWSGCWRPALETTAEAAECGGSSTVRQHALSALTSLFVESSVSNAPINDLSNAIVDVCIPLVRRRYSEIRKEAEGMTSSGECAIEVELCIGLIFKPLLHHLQRFVDENNIVELWKKLIAVLEEILLEGRTYYRKSDDNAKDMIEISREHLHSVITSFIRLGKLSEESQSQGDLTDVTWTFISKLAFCNDSVKEWKEAARQAQIR